MDATTEIRDGYGFDVARLEKFLAGEITGFAGPLTAKQFAGGQSNPTYLLTTPGARYVLRRKPPGELLASAHAVDREFRVIKALGEQSQVPVARALVLCKDDSIIGTWFYVMEAVDGRVFWDTTFPEVGRADRPLYFDAMNSALANLHSVDYAAIGLGDFGRPGSYFTRQIGRWSKQYGEDEAAGRVPTLDRLIDWLSANIPPGDDASIVHGDYRCDNLIFHPSEPRVLAILDWELSTIGHPLADFGYHLMIYRMPRIGVTGMLNYDLAALNIPGEAEYVRAYCKRTGRAGIPNLDFYLAFNMFRMAAIFHGIRGRMLRGTASSERAKEYAAAVEPMAEIGWRQAERAMRANG